MLASGNTHKMEEFQRILTPHQICIPDKSGIDFIPEETGSSYLENALLKANAALRIADGLPVLADDSGLSVPALGGAPGIHSARYGSDEAGRELTSKERNALLLRHTVHLKGEDRKAFFVCCLVFMLDDYRITTVQEIFPGYLATEPHGSGGFGYDPIFYIPDLNCTVSEIPAEIKDSLSHRGRAVAGLLSILDTAG